MDKSGIDEKNTNEAVMEENVSEQLADNGSIQKIEPRQKKSKIHIAVYMMCGIIIAVAVIMLILYILLERHGKKEIENVTDGFISSLNNESGTELYGLLSEEYIDYLSVEYGYSKLDVIKEMENSLAFFTEDAEDEVGYNLGELKGISVYERYVPESEPDELLAMKDYFSEEFSIAIDGYAVVYLKCNVNGEKKSMKMLMELYLYEIDGKWYFLDWYWDDLDS